jgi:hypothetical protein
MVHISLDRKSKMCDYGITLCGLRGGSTEAKSLGG